jgi:glycine/D-amino acid oxidase-like deaminating enzyme
MPAELINSPPRQESLTLPLPVSSAPLPRTADVVIVGSGIVGSAIAFFLSRARLKVCLIDRSDLGAGTTSAAAIAGLLQTKTSAVKLALARESLELLDGLHAEFEHSFQFDRAGSVLAAQSETEFQVVRDMVSKLKVNGLEVEIVDGDGARAAMPVLGPLVIGASICRLDAIINPLELVMSYVRHARRLGATFCTGTEVTGIECRGDKVTGVQTNRGGIATPKVVDACGVWSPAVARMVGFDLPIKPRKGEILVTEPVPPFIKGTLIAARYLVSKASTQVSSETPGASRTVGVTLAQARRGNLIVGSTREFAGYDRRSTYAGIHELARQLVEIVPTMKNIRVIRSYAGQRPITPDGLPVISGLPGMPDFVVATGHEGDGIVLSAVTASIVTNLITGAPDARNIEALSCARFNPKEEKLV